MVDTPPTFDEKLHSFPPGRFRFAETVGSGSHAQVIKAWDQQLRRTVAVKLTLDPTSFARMSAEEFADLDVDQNLQDLVALTVEIGSRYTPLREARLLALVDHPNVIQVLDIGLVHDRMIAVVMPYLEGGTLARRKFTGSWEEVLEAALLIGWGLAALHDAGILHRDLKPSNILFDRDGRPRIADLGSLAGRRTPRRSPSGSARGTTWRRT